MTQMGLTFDPPRARRSDPVTSHLAAQEMYETGAADRQAQSVLGMVQMRPGMTSAGLAAHFGADRYMVARRLPELEARGLVRKGKSIRCPVSGRAAVTWWGRDDGRPHGQAGPDGARAAGAQGGQEGR